MHNLKTSIISPLATCELMKRADHNDLSYSWLYSLPDSAILQ